MTKDGELTSLEDYVTRAKPDQDAIYYLYGSSRKAVEESPYLETFKSAGIEVLFMYDPSDEFVMNHLGEFGGKRLVSADSADVKTPDATAAAAGEPLPAERMDGLCKWAKDVLGEDVREVIPSRRLTESPAAATNADRMMTPSMRRLLRLIKDREGNAGASADKQPVNLELNPKHELVARLDKMRASDPALAGEVLRQVYDNSMMAAGFLENPQEMVRRINRLLTKIDVK